MERLMNSTVVLKFKTMVGGDNSNSIKYLIGFALILGLTAFLTQFHSSEKVPAVQTPPAATMDTYVPKGMTLALVQLSNYESLDQLIGKYGVADLYAPPLSPLHKPVLIAKKVKLVRAGRNPPTFYALVRESENMKIMQQSGEITALVRNPDSLGTKFVNRKTRTRSRKIYYDMETK